METSGSNSVFAAAALEHIDALYGYALTLTRDKTEAEDLVQETYLRAVKAANPPAPEGNLKAWLFVIMRNAWLNIARHNQNGRRVFEFESDEHVADVAPDSNPHVVYLRNLCTRCFTDSAARSFSRARPSRDMTVPAGQFNTVAIS